MSTELAAQVVPYLIAVATAYGVRWVDRVRDAAADATADTTVGLGRRMLRAVLRRDELAPGTTDAVTQATQDLAGDPDDTDRVAALRWQVRKLLESDPQLAAELADLVGQAGRAVHACGDRSVAVEANSGIVQTGDNSTARQGPR